MSFKTIGIYLMLGFVYLIGVYELRRINIRDKPWIVATKVVSIIILVLFLGKLIISTAIRLK